VNQDISKLHKQHCKNTGAALLLTKEQLSTYLNQFPLWSLSTDEKTISRQFKFNNYDNTLHFVNAVAEIAKLENHHPNIEFSYNTCTIHYQTHSANGITLYDFICAAHIEQL